MNFIKLVYVLMVVICCYSISCTNNANRKKSITELDTISFSNLSRKAYDYLYSKQDECDSVYHIGSFQHWYYDQTTGKITFSNKDTIKLLIDYEEVGSVSLKSNTWLWSWQNSSIEDNVKSEITKVRDYGDKRGFDKLNNAKWKADLYDGWEMTAISAYLMKAKGAYRVPIHDSSLYSFMIFKNIRVIDSLTSNKENSQIQ